MFNKNMLNKTPVIAIGLDAADALLIEKWINEGHLPNFRKLQQEGGYGRLHNTVNYCGRPEPVASTEILWPAFISGCRADKTGYWDIIKYYPDRYDISCDLADSGSSYHDYPPFYALGEQYKIAVFDQPYAHLCDRVNGVQILGWGGTFPYTESASHPPQLFSQITEKYGNNPILFNDTGMWWDKKYINWEKQALQQSIANRTAICRDLLRRESWDLFLTNFNEPHTVGHDLYAFSDPEHPLYHHVPREKNDVDPVLETYKQIDRAIGEILSEVADHAYILCFSPHGMGLNYSDLLSQTFLPEVLYRYSFPGKVAIAGKLGCTPPPVITKPVRNSWPGNVWVNLHEPNPVKKLIKTWTHKNFLKSNQHGLRSPYSQEALEKPMGWMPSMWFQPLWPQMKAFALPAFADGHIRINLKGRERDGIVTSSEYETICDELTQILYRLQDARTGKPIVKKVVRTRRYATEDDPRLPNSDLIVVWQEQMTDVIDSPDFGRIGPVIYYRSGSHWERGFLMMKGPGITPGSHLPQGDIVDLPATILKLMGLPIPEYFDGKPLVNNLALHRINT